MKEQNLQVFDFRSRKVRIVMIDGAPWWVVSDVCNVLDIKNPRQAVARLPKDDVSQTDVTDSSGRKQIMNITNESGVFELIFRSEKPEAQTFRHFVTNEILPSIRKHGAYIAPRKIDEILQNHEALAALAQVLKNEQDKVKALEAQIEADSFQTLFGKFLVPFIYPCQRNTALIGEFVKIQREGNLVLVWLDEQSDVPPTVAWVQGEDWIRQGNAFIRELNTSPQMGQEVGESIVREDSFLV
jgi:prophage antirepressor-like protein